MPRKTIDVPFQVSKLLKIFCDEVKAMLNGKFMALYIFGSLGMGDFSEHQSDIDFLALITAPLSDLEGKRLQVIHDKLRAIRFGDKLEGEYVVISALRAGGVKRTVARCEGGTLQLDVQNEVSAENIFDIRQNAYVICGPDPKSIVPHVSRESVKKIMQDYLRELNEELEHVEPKNLNWLSSKVLDICRTLYTLKTGRITSKSAGAKWALRVLSPEWKLLISRSLAVRHGNSKEDDKTFIATALPRFVDYALSYYLKCRKLEAKHTK
jgi:hypothetical protein